LGGTVLVGEGVELVDQPFGMDPVQAVAAELELPGIVTDDHGVGEPVVRPDAAPERTFRGDEHRIGRDVARRDAEPVEMGLPPRAIG
jgi:hypothetical protein